MLPEFKVVEDLKDREGVEGVVVLHRNDSNPNFVPQCENAELQQAIKIAYTTDEKEIFVALRSYRITVQKWNTMTVAIAVANGHAFNKSLQRKLERLRELHDPIPTTAVQSPQWAPSNGQRVL